METPFPAYRGDQPYVFVCYAHDDAGSVYAELKRLRERGLNFWYDEGVTPGHEWTQQLADAIDGASQVLYFVSPASGASRHCRNEIQYSLEQGKRIIPVHLETTELPGGLKLSLGSAQAIYRYDLNIHDYERKIGEALELAGTPGATLPASRGSRFGNRRTLLSVLAAVLFFFGVSYWLSVPSPVETPAVDGTDPAIAVLPFVNMSGDPANEYFSDGLAEEVLNGLVRMSQLKVVARTSSFQFRGENVDVRDIANRLGVSHVLEGSVRSSGSRLRVSAQLVRATDGVQIWSDVYERQLTDAFVVQDEISQQILDRLEVELTGSMAPRIQVPAVALDAYLIGRARSHEFLFNDAVAQFSIAIQEAPDFADAYASRANARRMLTIADKSAINPTMLDLIDADIDRALRLDPEHPIALGVRAHQKMLVDRAYGTALGDISSLLNKHPNDAQLLVIATGMFEMVGGVDQITAISDHLVDLDPLSPVGWFLRWRSRAYVGDYEPALSYVRRAVDLTPSALPLFSLCQTLVFAEDWPQAEACIAELESNTGPDDEWRPLWVLTDYHFRRGEIAKAEEMSRRLERLLGEGAPVMEHTRAQVAFLTGDIDGWLTHEKRALSAGEPIALMNLRPWPGADPKDPRYSKWLADPRRSELLASMGLDDASLAEIHIPSLSF